MSMRERQEVQEVLWRLACERSYRPFLGQSLRSWRSLQEKPQDSGESLAKIAKVSEVPIRSFGGGPEAPSRAATEGERETVVSTWVR